MWDDFNFTKIPFKDYETKLDCKAWVATAIIGAGALGAGATIYGANAASDAQTNAANTAANTSLSMYNTTRGDLDPYRQIGKTASDQLTEQLPHLTSDIDVTKLLQDPNSTPAKAYDFTRTQGLKATQNSAAARGLGVSGAALKGAATFATGLADNTYTNLFNLENTNRTNAYTRLKGLVDTGENAAAQTGNAGTAAATTAAGAQIGAGNAQAAGANATGGAIANLSNNIGGYAAYKGLYGNNGNTGGGSTYNGNPTTGYDINGNAFGNAA